MPISPRCIQRLLPEPAAFLRTYPVLFGNEQLPLSRLRSGAAWPEIQAKLAQVTCFLMIMRRSSGLSEKPLRLSGG